MGRRATSLLLLAVGSLLVSLWGGLFWVQRNISDRSAAVALLTKQLDQPVVRQALADQIVLLLPDAGALDAHITETTAAALDSAQFRTVFAAAAGRAHRFLLDGNEGYLSLDLSAFVPALTRVLGRSDPTFAAVLPPDLSLEIVFANQSDLPSWFESVRSLPAIATVVGAVGALMIVGGCVVARRRLLALGMAVVGVAAFSGMGAVAVRAAPSHIASVIGSGYQTALDTIAADVLHGLFVQLTATAAAGVIIGVGLLAGAVILRPAPKSAAFSP